MNIDTLAVAFQRSATMMALAPAVSTVSAVSSESMDIEEPFTEEFAMACGRYMDPRSPVYVAASTLPGAGRGVFAAVDLPAGAFVTFYEGTVLPSDDPAVAGYHRDYLYELNDEYTLCSGEEMAPGYGMAQLVNDCIHPIVSGYEHNAAYVVEDARILLKTTVDVAAHEELFADYHISYWIGRYKRASLPADLREWLRCVAVIEDWLRLFGWTIDDYIDTHDHAEALVPGGRTGRTRLRVVPYVDDDAPAETVDYPCTCDPAPCGRRRRIDIYHTLDERGEVHFHWACAECECEPAA